MEIKGVKDPRLGRTHITIAWLEAVDACGQACDDIRETFNLETDETALELSRETVEKAYKASIHVEWIIHRMVQSKDAEEIENMIYKGAKHNYEKEQECYAAAISEMAAEWARILQANPAFPPIRTINY